MYKTIIEPRVSETDGVGHINNTTLPVWLEAARNPIFKLFTPDDSFADWRMIILHTSIDYVSQIYFGTNVDVYTWVKRIGKSSLELYEEIHQSGTICARGKAIYVNYNKEEQKPEPIPTRIRKELEEHLYEREGEH
ncbi:acyl-CoA thioesterase [Salicibibacter cibarius]|uniref:Acyl-CoA thioesterase n=1 Tax=Salicibibacter cibarius TaxID=2743000 RepID=A0A7T6Z4I2_9BACI|nr:thioesterase family protein [Salicibibacter cibarius]QQK76587.1 acyl-CoA thioesterase [Salicibibacter cibarius]